MKLPSFLVREILTCASKIRLVMGGRAMISPDMRHNFLFSSRTVFMLSIHSESTGPSKINHFRSVGFRFISGLGYFIYLLIFFLDIFSSLKNIYEKWEKVNLFVYYLYFRSLTFIFEISELIDVRITYNDLHRTFIPCYIYLWYKWIHQAMIENAIIILITNYNKKSSTWLL